MWGREWSIVLIIQGTMLLAPYNNNIVEILIPSSMLPCGPRIRLGLEGAGRWSTAEG